ncbi:hypothetical protein ACFV97_14890 [Streptomyces sp. NPDC059913]|uniref:hypothetical protein n=1 Tax=unclassified Streptomyces TaxID=2593676 RepID=UPI00365E3C70
MATVIPGALADYLTGQSIADAETVAALDSARRGRGRTLVIEPTSTRVLHVISAYAEAILESRKLHTAATVRAARLWIQRVGHAPAAEQAAPVATNAFEQGATGLFDATRPGRYQLRVCEAPRDVCERGLCRTTSTRAVGTLDEVRAAAAMFRHAWPVDEQGNPVEDDDQAVDLENLAVSLPCPTCHVATGARCVTRASTPARETHGRRFEAVEEAAGITRHRAAEERAAKARGGWVITYNREAEAALLATYAARLAERAAADVEAQQAAALVTEAEATGGTWQGAWIGDQDDDGTLFPVATPTEQGALFRP